MKTRGAGFVVCCVLGFFPGLKSLAQEAATAPESSLASLSQKLLYSEISAYLQDGSALVGFLAGIEPDALIVRKDGQDIKVPRRNLKKIVLETEINFNRNMLYGMVAGLYAGNIVLLHEFSQPFAFAKRLEQNEPWLGFIYEPAFAACGIGLGYLATLLERGEKTFDFGPGREAGAAAWERFLGFVAGSTGPPKTHISIHAGSVHPGISSTYDGLLRKAGYDSYAGYASARLNLLRRAQVTYSLLPPLEFGLAYLSASEPGSYYYFLSIDDETTVSMSVDPRYLQKGIYLVGAYRPEWSQKASGAVGFGVGAARARIGFSGYRNVSKYMLDPVSQSYWTWVALEEKHLAYEKTKTFFSGFAFAEMNVRIYDNLYLGISGDYVFNHAEEIPAFEDFRLPARKARLGNVSLGLVFGWHF